MSTTVIPPHSTARTIPSWLTLDLQMAQERLAAEYPRALAVASREDKLQELLEGYSNLHKAKLDELLAGIENPDDNDRLCCMERLNEFAVTEFVPPAFR